MKNKIKLVRAMSNKELANFLNNKIVERKQQKQKTDNKQRSNYRFCFFPLAPQTIEADGESIDINGFQALQSWDDSSHDIIAEFEVSEAILIEDYQLYADNYFDAAYDATVTIKEYYVLDSYMAKDFKLIAVYNTSIIDASQYTDFSLENISKFKLSSEEISIIKNADYSFQIDLFKDVSKKYNFSNRFYLFDNYDWGDVVKKFHELSNTIRWRDDTNTIEFYEVLTYVIERRIKTINEIIDIEKLESIRINDNHVNYFATQAKNIDKFDYIERYRPFERFSIELLKNAIQNLILTKLIY